MQYSVIQKSQLEGGLRLDAEYYQPEYLEVAKILQSAPHKNFNEVVSNIINGAEIREYVKEDGLAYLRVSDIKEFFIDSSSVVHISKESKVKQNIKLRENDILLSRSGSLAIAAVVTPDLSNSVISSHLMRIPVKGINPYFLVAFLNSKFGKDQIMQRNNGTIVPEINHPSLKSLLIPILSEDIQKEIEKIVRNAYEEIQASDKTYSQAENLLLEELGLKDFEIDDDLSYIVNLSEIKSAHRADAEYFQPKYEKLIQVAAKKFDVLELKQVFSFKRGIFISTSYYSEEKTSRPYIRIKELSGGKAGIDESKVIFINEECHEDKNNTLKENDLVIAIIGDTIGKTNRISKELSEGFCSNNTGRLRIKSEWASKIIPEFSEVLFQSIFIQSQVERKMAQTGQPKIGDDEVKTIKIPILSKATQQKIADLVQKSHEARSKAKQLSGQARNRVENLIKVKS